MDLLLKVLIFTIPFGFLYEYVYEVFHAKSKGVFLGSFSEGLLLMLSDMKSFLDFFRHTIIYTLWAFILVILIRNDTNWAWNIVWMIGGYILLLNLVGFATLPLYAILGYKNYKKMKNALYPKNEDN